MIRKVAEDVFAVQGRDPLIDVAVELEKVARSDEYFKSRSLYPNVDFYSGALRLNVSTWNVVPPDLLAKNLTHLDNAASAHDPALVAVSSQRLASVHTDSGGAGAELNHLTMSFPICLPAQDPAANGLLQCQHLHPS